MRTSRQQQKAVMQSEKDQAVTTLAASSAQRAVQLLPNTLIALRWDGVVIEMRTHDLLALSQQLSQLTQELNLDQHELYQLWLDNNCLNLSRSGLRQFVDMVNIARAGLPRQIVYWMDLTVSLIPHHPVRDNGRSLFSKN